MSFLRKMFSGKVSQEDPRRFLVECMLGAMEADGDVSEPEMEALQRNLEEHDLFTGLTRDEVQRFVDLAADAIREAGGGRSPAATTSTTGSTPSPSIRRFRR